MVRKQYFRDSVDDNEHAYDMQDFASFHRILLGGEGISNTKGAPTEYNDLEYTSNGGMQGKVGSGYASALGYVMELTEPETLTHDTSDPDHDRIDRVVIRFKLNPENAEFKPYIIKGKPDSNPKAPSVEDNHDEYDVKIAQVKVRADKASIDDDDITDERKGNYIPIDNLQRGVIVDEKGIATMPNQSFIKVVHTTGQGGFKVPDDESIPIPMDDAEIDRQNEIKDGKKGLFVPKADGAYIFYEHMAFDEGELNENSDVKLQLYVNGDYVTTLTARTPAHRKDNIFDGSAIEFLEAGDEVEFKLTVVHAPDNLEVRNHRLFISKLN